MKLTIGFLAVFLLLESSTAWSQERESIQPKLQAAEVIPDVEYCTGGGHPLRLDMTRPKVRPDKPMPVVVYLHGGGWRGHKGKTGTRFASRGFFGVVVDFRPSDEAPFPAQLEDVKCAIRFLRAKAKEFHIDTARIAVWGDSSGGHIAALLGTTGNVKEFEGAGGWQDFSSRVNAVILVSAPTDLQRAFEEARQLGITEEALAQPRADVEQFIGGRLEESKEKLARANPIAYVAKDDPPFLLIHGDQDQVVSASNSIWLYEALKAANVPAELDILKGSGHNISGESSFPLILGFLDHHSNSGLQHSGPEF